MSIVMWHATDRCTGVDIEEEMRRWAARRPDGEPGPRGKLSRPTNTGRCIPDWPPRPRRAGDSFRLPFLYHGVLVCEPRAGWGSLDVDLFRQAKRTARNAAVRALLLDNTDLRASAGALRDTAVSKTRQQEQRPGGECTQLQTKTAFRLFPDGRSRVQQAESAHSPHRSAQHSSGPDWLWSAGGARLGRNDVAARATWSRGRRGLAGPSGGPWRHCSVSKARP